MQDVQARKERLYELEAQINQSRGTPVVSSIREYCDLQYEEAKEQLVSCSTEEFVKLQATAETYYAIIDMIDNSDKRLSDIGG